MQFDVTILIGVIVPLVVVFGLSILTMTIGHLLLSVKSNRFATEASCLLGLGVFLGTEYVLGSLELYRTLLMLVVLTLLMFVEALRPSDMNQTCSPQLVEINDKQGRSVEDALCFSTGKNYTSLSVLEVTGIPFESRRNNSDDTEQLKFLYPLWRDSQKTRVSYTVEIVLENGLARYLIFITSQDRDWNRSLDNVRRSRQIISSWLKRVEYNYKSLDSREIWRAYSTLTTNETSALLVEGIPSDTTSDLGQIVHSLLEKRVTGHVQLTFTAGSPPILTKDMRALQDDPQKPSRTPFRVEEHQLRDLYKQMAELEACEETGAFQVALSIVTRDEDQSLVETVVKSEWGGIETRGLSSRHMRRVLSQFLLRRPIPTNKTSVSGARLSALLQATEMIPGIPNHITPPAFAIPQQEEDGTETITLGMVLHKKRMLAQEHRIPTMDFCLHAGIFGSPGSGKTNTSIHIISQLAELGYPFLVLNPAKTEWRQLASILSDVRIFTAGDESIAPFRYNFLDVPLGVSINTHMRNVANCFIASWPSEGIMTEHILKIFRRAYTNAKWDFLTNERGSPILLSDLYAAMEEVVQELDYGRLQQDFVGALKARFGTLMDDVVLAVMLNTEQGLTIPELIDNRTIIEIRNLDDSQKSLITSLITVAMAEYLEAQDQSPLQDLHHILVLEEAHHILKRVGVAGNIHEGHSSQQQAVDTLVNLLREARGLGLGVILIDQLPGDLADAAIKLPGITIIHQMKDPRERHLVGGQVNLDEDQILYSGTLGVGEIIVHQGFAYNPVNVQVDHRFNVDEMWTNERVIHLMRGFYTENPHLLIQLLPDTNNWSPNPNKLRKLMILVDSPDFLGEYNERNNVSRMVGFSYIQGLVERFISNPSEVDLYSEILESRVKDSLRDSQSLTAHDDEVIGLG
ncbi:MAG: DUF87 domain-containing protein [Candidatus Thorarchaeota archaeon]